MSSIRLKLNGVPIVAEASDPNMTLLAYLRERGLTGVKEGCAEGECGACAVILVRPENDRNKSRYRAVNSCLFLLASADGQEVLTVEGVEDKNLHPVQEAMVREGGSQCGYCTPGFVMGLFAEYYRPGRAEGVPDLENIAGNLCRCTGYRPIRSAARGLPLIGQENRSADPFAERLEQPAPADTSLELQGPGGSFERPLSLADALDARKRLPKATLITGGTDVVVGMNQNHRRHDALLSLEAVEELRVFEVRPDKVRIGAAMTLSEIEEALEGLAPERRIVLLEQLMPLFASRLIRNRATLAGNIATASPIGDSPVALLALDATLHLASVSGERRLALSEFFLGYRQTALAEDELILAIEIPNARRGAEHIRQAFYKVSKRQHDDITSVSAAFRLLLSPEGSIEEARLAYGGVAATSARAKEAEKALLGKRWNQSALEDALTVLGQTFTPLSDHRASAEYRQAMIGSLLRKFHAQTGEGRSGEERSGEDQ